jgi:K+-sensing histidine kinase KdpD
VQDARYNLGDTAGSDPARLDAAPVDSARGRLSLFQGYASGFGKSFRMFDETRRRKKRGQDVVAEHKLVQGHPTELSSQSWLQLPQADVGHFGDV